MLSEHMHRGIQGLQWKGANLYLFYFIIIIQVISNSFFSGGGDMRDIFVWGGGRGLRHIFSNFTV